MVFAPRMLLIGSAGRNSGKTEFACALIRKLRACEPITAVKVTAIQERDGLCPRGGKGCGVCTSLDGAYAITEEAEAGGAKDTQRMLAAGACKVYWLRVMKEHLEAGVQALLALLPAEGAVVCESNSLRTVVEPGLFLMFRRHDSKSVKASAAAVEEYVDQWVVFDGHHLDFDPANLELDSTGLVLRYPATAIVLAGGGSSRMGLDKSLLPVQERPMIEHVCAQLQPHFQEVLISANDLDKLAFLGFKIVPDKVPGHGPLMGIASALEASQHDLNLVVACDIPDVNLRLVRRMMRASAGYDAVIPKTGESYYEPLFAAYQKSALGAMQAALAARKRRPMDVAASCKVRYLDLTGEAPPLNINTREDYERFVSGAR